MDKGLLDIGLLLEPVEFDRYDYFRIPVEEKWCAVVNSDSVLAKKKFITSKDLLNEKLILPRRSNVKNELSAWLGKDISKLNIVATNNLNSNTVVMVSKKLAFHLQFKRI